MKTTILDASGLTDERIRQAEVFSDKEAAAIISDATEKIRYAAGVLRAGGLVAFPTETVYGLGADGLNPDAVAGIYKAKNRPADNPLILHVSSVDEAKALTTNWHKKAELLAERFCAGHS